MLKAWLNPKLRVGAFLLTLNLAWMAAVWMWVEREHWLWIIPVALSINFILLTYDQLFHFRLLAGHPVLGNDAWGLLKMINELSEELHVPAPKIFLIPRPSAQIFSYAKRRAHTRLFITQGTLELLNTRQLRAVLTFQMMTVRASYNILNYWLAALLDICFRLGKALERAFRFVFGWSPPIAAALVAPWLWLLQFFLLSPRDFLKLDRQTARHIENPEDLALALWKMEAYAHTKPWSEPWIFAHMCLVSPFAFPRTHNLLRVQPNVKNRIKNLTGRYPL